MSDAVRKPFSNEALGVIYGLGAYLCWGLFPIYWKMLLLVPSMQILAHRIVWAFIFTLALSIILKRQQAIRAVLASPRRLLSVIAAGVLVSFNWGLYIWAVNASRIIETSMGYYLNPLLSAALGAIVLREKLDKGMIIAYVIAGMGIVFQSIVYGTLPWVSLSLAFTFAAYSLIKKMAALDALTGMMMETAVVFPVALVFLVFEHRAGHGAFGLVGSLETGLLVMAGSVTALPLMMYAAGVKRIALSKMGIIQYISPTSQFLLGVLLYGERIDLTRGIAFACVVVALLIFGLTRTRTKPS
jgi:chloramphenicol-sensitive protein RarD